MTTLESDTQKVIRTFNLELILTTLLIFAYGLVILYSGTNGPGLQHLYKSQIIWFGLSVLIGAAIIFVDPQVLQKFSYLFYALCILLLLSVLLVGKVGGGSQRWLNLGVGNLQPSEICKIAIVFAYARYFANDQTTPPYTLRRLLIPALILAPSFILICLQPDMGTAIILALSAASMVIFLGIDWRSWLILILIGAVTIPISYQFLLKDYQRRRVITFLNPGSDPRGSGYNAIQSKIAVGSGKLFGKGYLKGTQSQLNFIPKQQTDFIFSVLAEEFGFVGSIGLLLLYFFYCVFSMRTVARARDKFEMLLAFGLMSILFWHVFINLGMVSGILPIVGVTLPFMSYGGSSLLTFVLVTGLILNVSRKRYIF